MDIADRALQLEDGKLMEVVDFVAKDDVCGMFLQKSKAVAKMTDSDIEYFFAPTPAGNGLKNRRDSICKLTCSC